MAPETLRCLHIFEEMPNLEAISFNSNDLPWIICNQLDLLQAEIRQNLSPNSIVAEIRLKAQLQIGFDRVTTLILKSIRLNLVQSPDSTAFLIEVEQDASPFLLNDLHRGVQLIPAVAPQ